MKRRQAVLRRRLAALSVILANAAHAQTVEDAPPVPGEIDEITVTSGRVRGGALSEIEPELVLDEEAIAAYGVSSFGELLEAIDAELSSGRSRSGGEPVVLLNGRRVAGFQELDNYPVEALARVEVLPEEVSLAYGFGADQRVLNFVLKPDIAVNAATARIGRPGEGAQIPAEIIGQRLQIDGDQRIGLDFEAKWSDRIRERDRDVAFSGPVDDTAYRTVAPELLDVKAGFTASTGVFDGAVATLSGSYANRFSEDRIGRAGDGVSILTQSRKTDDIFSGVSVASALAPSTWTFDANFSRIALEIETDRPTLPPAKRETQSIRRTVSANFVLNQRLADLAAGRFALTAAAGFSAERQQARIDDTIALTRSEAQRTTFSGKASLDLPVDAFGPLPGVFLLNANIDLRRLSDLDLLTTYGFGATWKPDDSFRIVASTSREEGAPTLADLAGPRIVTPNSRVFDFRFAEDALVDVVSGGNSALGPDSRRVWKLGAQWKLSEKPGVQLNLDYTRSRIENETRSFLLLTEQFEQAFPGRVLRGADGRLLAFDRRPVEVETTTRNELRTMVTFTQPIKARRVNAAAAPKPTKKRRSGRPGSLRVVVVHRWTLRDEVVADAGLPAFDFLDGAASGGLGGTPAHVIDTSIYRWNNGLGVALAGRYLSATTVDDPGGDLAFSDVFLANFRATYELNYNDALLRRFPFLEETRVSFGVDNLFDEKVQVVDDAGLTPINFQEDLLNPFGRTFRFELRRRF